METWNKIIEMYNIEVYFRIICQTLSVFGFGFGLCITIILFQPGGHEIVSKIYSNSIPFIGLNFVLCCMGTFCITIDNIRKMKMKSK